MQRSTVSPHRKSGASKERPRKAGLILEPPQGRRWDHFSNHMGDPCRAVACLAVNACQCARAVPAQPYNTIPTHTASTSLENSNFSAQSSVVNLAPNVHAHTSSPALACRKRPGPASILHDTRTKKKPKGENVSTGKRGLPVAWEPDIFLRCPQLARFRHKFRKFDHPRPPES